MPRQNHGKHVQFARGSGMVGQPVRIVIWLHQSTCHLPSILPSRYRYRYYLSKKCTVYASVHQYVHVFCNTKKRDTYTRVRTLRTCTRVLESTPQQSYNARTRMAGHDFSERTSMANKYCKYKPKGTANDVFNSVTSGNIINQTDKHSPFNPQFPQR